MLCIGTTGSVGGGISEMIYRRAAPLFLETRPNLGPRRFKKSLGPALRARLIQVRSVIRRESFRNFRRHKIHTKSRRDGLCISDFRFGFRNHR